MKENLSHKTLTYVIGDKLVGKYEWNLMEKVVLLHKYTIGSSDFLENDDIDCFEFVYYRMRQKESYNKKLSEFDRKVRELCEITLSDYKWSRLWDNRRPRIKELENKGCA